VGPPGGDDVDVPVVFVQNAPAGVANPVLMNLILGSRAEHTLTEMKEWLIDNNATVMSVLFVVIGVKLLGDGISIVA
jgi:hypothetical protein